MNSKELFERRNVDDILIREVWAGLLRILNQQLVYQQVWSDDEDGIENVTVPFFADFGESFNTERFLQDNYAFFGTDKDGNCTSIGLKKIPGNYDAYPRGIVSFSSCQIDSGNITNRFVMGKYEKRIGNEIKSFVSFLYSIPLTLSFKIEIRSETFATALKIDQAFRELFYKNKTFYVLFRNTKIACRCGFGEALQLEKGAAYTFGGSESEKYFKQTMDLSIETYQPVWDKTAEMPADVSISNFTLQSNVNSNSGFNRKELALIDNYSNSTVSADSDLFLEWQYMTDNIDLPATIDVYYKEKDSNEEIMIGSSMNNFFTWHVPAEMSAYKDKVDVIIPNVENEMVVYKEPAIEVIADPSTKIVKPENTIIKNKGYFLTDYDYALGVFSYYNSNSEQLEEIEFKLNLLNNQIDLENPIEFRPFVYQGEFFPKCIDIIIRDRSDKNVSSIIENILVE